MRKFDQKIQYKLMAKIITWKTKREKERAKKGQKMHNSQEPKKRKS